MEGSELGFSFPFPSTTITQVLEKVNNQTLAIPASAFAYMRRYEQMEMAEPTVNVAARVPFSAWQKLMALAQDRGLTRRGRPNVSAAARIALERGIEIVSEESKSCRQEQA
jgi:hypothetical protein